MHEMEHTHTHGCTLHLNLACGCVCHPGWPQGSRSTCLERCCCCCCVWFVRARSTKREPLGRGYVRGHKVPEELADRGFGVVYDAIVSGAAGCKTGAGKGAGRELGKGPGHVWWCLVVVVVEAAGGCWPAGAPLRSSSSLRGTAMQCNAMKCAPVDT